MKTCPRCDKEIMRHWKYCNQCGRGCVLLDIDIEDMKTREIKETESSRIHRENKSDILTGETDTCLMCGMELMPYKKDYNTNLGNITYIRRPRRFCDMMCYAYFNKRLHADEFNIKLEE